MTGRPHIAQKRTFEPRQESTVDDDATCWPPSNRRCHASFSFSHLAISGYKTALWGVHAAVKANDGSCRIWQPLGCALVPALSLAGYWRRAPSGGGLIPFAAWAATLTVVMAAGLFAAEVMYLG